MKAAFIALLLLPVIFISCEKDLPKPPPGKTGGGDTMPRVGGVRFNLHWNPYYNNDSTQACWSVDLRVSSTLSGVHLGTTASFLVSPGTDSAKINSVIAGKYYYQAHTRMMCLGKDSSGAITKIDSFTHPGGYVLQVPVTLP